MAIPRFIKIKDHDNLVKDTKTGAVLNIDRTALSQHESITKKLEKEKQRDLEINNIKSEISEIKQLLKLAIKKIEG